MGTLRHVGLALTAALIASFGVGASGPPPASDTGADT